MKKIEEVETEIIIEELSSSSDNELDPSYANEKRLK